jgi:hypothetical protein
MRRRLRLPVLGVVAGLALLAGCGVTTTALHDERYDLAARPNGAIVVIGDSVGYGLTVYGGITATLAVEGWGPIRSFSQLGLHASPESATDQYTVVNQIGAFRAVGLEPRVAVVVAGANDVGYWQGDNATRNAQRIEAAMSAIGPNVHVAWTTIAHGNATLMNAWNQALWDVATRYPNLHVCDWAAAVAQQPHLLERDGVHMTVGANGGYAAMRDFVTGCVRQFALG